MWLTSVLIKYWLHLKRSKCYSLIEKWPKYNTNNVFLTFILPNSNWKTLGLVAWAKTAGNNFVLGSTLNKQVNLRILVKGRGTKKKNIFFLTTKVTLYRRAPEVFPSSRMDVLFQKFSYILFHYYVNIFGWPYCLFWRANGTVIIQIGKKIWH